jgi:hypothetical protein
VLARFFGDQVVERVNRSILAKLTDVPQVAFVIAICFLPWWGSLADAFRSWRRERGGSMLPRDSACVMLAGWSLIFLLLASCVDRVNVRYQTPIVPFVSALAAGLLASLGRERQRFWFTRLGRIASVALGTVAIGTAAICLATGESARLGVIGGLIGCYVAVGFAVYSSRMNCQQMAFGAVLTLLLIVPLSYVAASGLVTKTLEEKLLARINALHGSDNTIGLLAKPAYASRLRVASGGTLDVRWLGNSVTSHGDTLETDRHNVLILYEEDADQIDLTDFRLEQVDNGFQHLRAGEVITSAMTGELDDYLQTRRRRLTLAVRESAAKRAPRTKQEKIWSDSQELVERFYGPHNGWPDQSKVGVTGFEPVTSCMSSTTLQSPQRQVSSVFSQEYHCLIRL